MARRGCRECSEEESTPSQTPEVDRELDFHYHRGERESLRRRPLPDHSSNNPFRGNRSLLILLIDVVVVLLLAGFYFYFLRGDPRETVIDGYRFNLSARSFDEGVLISLEVTSDGGRATPGEPFYLRLLDPPPEELSEEMISQEDVPADSARLLRGERVYDLLPTEGVRTVRVLLPVRIAGRELRVEVGWGETSSELSLFLEEGA